MTGLSIGAFYILTMGMNWILKFVPAQLQTIAAHSAGTR